MRRTTCLVLLAAMFVSSCLCAAEDKGRFEPPAKAATGYITSRGNTLYLIVFDAHEDGVLPLRATVGIRKVRMLGSGKRLKVENEPEKETVRVMTDDTKGPLLLPWN